MTYAKALIGAMNGLPPPDIIDRSGASWKPETIAKHYAKLISTNQPFFTHRAKNMTTDIDNATQVADTAIKLFSDKINQLVTIERKISEESKSIGGKVRDAAQKLGDGLARVEKAANFDKLERYVELLERAERAMAALAELEKSGRLDKIAGALR